MAWYKKQLEAKLKELDKKKPKSKSKKEEVKKIISHRFDPSKLKGGKNPFKNPVADMNRNRKKTDLPSA